MRLVEALRRPIAEDLSGFVALLNRHQVPCRVSEEAGQQVLRVPDGWVEPVRELHQRYLHGEVPEAVAVASVGRGGEGLSVIGQTLARYWLTSGVLLITFVVAGLTWLGEDLEMVRWLSFLDFRIQGGYIYFATLHQMYVVGDWWRLITPIFVHFGFLHLAMNSLWYWELGRRIEARQGALMLLGLTLLAGVASNFAQYWWGGPGIFGGLSGVLYALLGHCWLFQRLAPSPAYRLPQGVVILMLVWLVICLTGIIEVVSFGTVAIANAAHVSGLVVGCVTGVIGGALARSRGR